MLYPTTFERPFDPLGLPLIGYPTAADYWDHYTVQLGNALQGAINRPRIYEGWMPGALTFESRFIRTAAEPLPGTAGSMVCTMTLDGTFAPPPDDDPRCPRKFIVTGQYDFWAYWEAYLGIGDTEPGKFVDGWLNATGDFIVSTYPMPRASMGREYLQPAWPPFPDLTPSPDGHILGNYDTFELLPDSFDYDHEGSQWLTYGYRDPTGALPDHLGPSDLTIQIGNAVPYKCY